MSRNGMHSPVGSVKAALIVIVIAAVFVYTLIKELGSLLPYSMQGFVRTC